jgi:carbohydrate-selective porin OprB
LFDGRDDDVLGLGYAHGVFADSAASTYPENYESALEIYYKAHITPWFQLNPSLQYVANPGGSNTTQDTVVFGLRANITF